MTKVDFINHMYENAVEMNEDEEKKVFKKDSDFYLEVFTKSLVEILKAGEKLSIVGFGTFEVAERAERQARNPQTGAAIMVPACKVPKFKPAKALKELVNA
jgi:DNA-binding protein HU-beta|nr:MAG TPA: DNA binding protein [Caudoviricetes sp.]